MRIKPLNRSPPSDLANTSTQPPGLPRNQTKSPGQAKAAARAMYQWQLQVVRDPELSRMAYRVAIEISQAFDRDAEWAYRSHAWFAGTLRTQRSSIQEAIKSLVDRGHLLVKVSRGRGKANEYRLRHRADVPELVRAEAIGEENE